MNPVLAVVAAAVVVGAVAAVSARDGRAAILGLAMAMIAAPIVADPIPDPAALATRLAGALLVSYVVWIATRGVPTTVVSPLGWPAEALAGAAAAVAGWGIADVTTGALGPSEATGAGTALLVLSFRPIVFGREPLRIGIGLLLLMVGALLLRAGLLGAPTAVERIVEAGVLVAIGAGVAWRLRTDRPSETP